MTTTKNPPARIAAALMFAAAIFCLTGCLSTEKVEQAKQATDEAGYVVESLRLTVDQLKADVEAGKITDMKQQEQIAAVDVATSKAQVTVDAVKTAVDAVAEAQAGNTDEALATAQTGAAALGGVWPPATILAAVLGGIATYREKTKAVKRSDEEWEHGYATGKAEATKAEA